MKTILLTSLSVVTLILPASGMGGLEVQFGVRLTQTISNPFGGEAILGDSSDNRTVRMNWGDDFARGRWSFRFRHHLSGSLDLNGDYDAKLNEDVRVKMQAFPESSPFAFKYFVIQGANLKSVIYDKNADTIEIKAQPTMAAKTKSFSTDDQVGFGFDFYYNNVSEDFDLSVPYIVTDAYLDDTSAMTHPSSVNLKGVGLRVDGTDTEAVDFDFVVSDSFTMHHNIMLNMMMGYKDGMTPSSGFTVGQPTTPSYSIDLGKSGDTFNSVNIENFSWSAYDVQFGVFPDPLAVTSFSKDGSGFHIMWNNEDGKTYTIESTDNLNNAFGQRATGESGPNYTDSDTSSPQRFYLIKEE